MTNDNTTESERSSVNARWNSSSCSASACRTNSSSMPTRFSPVIVTAVALTAP